MVFGNKKDNQFSKSWSDLWDEEWELEEDTSLQQRRENNARSWSQDSKEVPSPDHPVGLFEPDSSSFLNSRSAIARRGSESSVFATPSKKADLKTAMPTPRSQNRSPRSPLGPSSVDKWAALGDRRRNFRPREETPRLKKQRSMNLSWRRDSGPSRSPQRRNPFLDKEWRRYGENKPNHDYHGSLDEDLDLVGGWHDLHL